MFQLLFLKIINSLKEEHFTDILWTFKYSQKVGNLVVGGRIPNTNIVNVKLAVGRRFGSVINPSGGGGHLEMMIDQLL